MVLDHQTRQINPTLFEARFALFLLAIVESIWLQCACRTVACQRGFVVKALLCILGMFVLYLPWIPFMHTTARVSSRVRSFSIHCEVSLRSSKPTCLGQGNSEVSRPCGNHVATSLGSLVWTVMVGKGVSVSISLHHVRRHRSCVSIAMSKRIDTLPGICNLTRSSPR